MDGLYMCVRRVTNGSYIGCTFEYNISHLLLQTYQLPTPLQPPYTVDTKNECNF